MFIIAFRKVYVGPFETPREAHEYATAVKWKRYQVFWLQPRTV